MKLEVGMYVKTKYGEIARIDKCLGEDSTYKNMEHYETDRMVTKFNNFILYKEDIEKASHNIIDLIEVGDYVNSEKVTLVQKYAKVNYKQGTCLIQTDAYDINDNEQFLIKSIVTKEQFESMQYKVD